MTRIKKFVGLFLLVILLLGGVTLLMIKNQNQKLLTGGQAGNGVVVTYPFAKGMEKFNDIQFLVQDKHQTRTVQLYAVNTNPKRNYPTDEKLLQKAAVAMFDLKGQVTVAVTYPEKVHSVVVRPLAAGIKAQVKDNHVIFKLKKWGQYSIEINGNPIKNDLLIFANPPQEKIPAKAKVIKGRIDEPLHILDNQTVYLTAGAVVDAPVTMGSNSKLLGRGILTQGGPPALDVENQKKVEINGISIFDPNDWVIQLYNSQQINLENVKIISCRDNSDGITIQSSQDVNIKHSFIRSWDDSIVLKNYSDQSTKNISVNHTLIWTDLAQSMEIGFETNKGSTSSNMSISKVNFKNIDVLHAYHKAPISIHNADNAAISDINFKDIVLEDAEMGIAGSHGEGGGWPYLIDFGNGNSAALGGDAGWTHNDGNRLIGNVTVDGVKVLSGRKSSCQLHLVNSDSDSKSLMKNIILKNIYYQNEKIDYTAEVKAAGLEKSILLTDK